jgi:peptide/nickel transport system ATP-binding protein
MLTIDCLSLDFRRYSGFARYTHVRGLGEISLSLQRGEVLAVVGASGGGKSLLAHAIMGHLPPNAVTSGTILLDGKPVDQAERQALCGNRFALVPQSISHLDPLVRSGRQIGWAARRGGRSARQSAAAVPAALDRFGLPQASARAFPHQLSGGMARRVLLAMATAGNAELVIADEPTCGLDAHNAQTALRQLRALADGGKAVMLITHDLVSALPFADRVAILRDGQLAALEGAAAFAGTADRLVSPYARALWQALPQNHFTAQAHLVDA